MRHTEIKRQPAPDATETRSYAELKDLFPGAESIHDALCQAISDYQYVETRETSLPKTRIALAMGADPNYTPYKKDGPVHKAAKVGHVEALKLLHEAGADLSTKRFSPTALYVVNYTHQNPVYCGNEITPAMFAAAGGHHEALQFLIKQNVDLESETETGWRAITFATNNGHVKIVKSLMDEKVRLDNDNLDDAPIGRAIIKNFLPLVTMLAQAGSDLNIKTCNNESAGVLAAEVRSESLMQVLIGFGANMDGAAFRAASVGNVDALKAMKLGGIDLNGEDGKFTPLMVAVCEDHLEVVKLLVDARINLNTKHSEQNNYTAAHYAMSRDSTASPAILQALGEGGADFTLKANDGSVVATWAEGRGRGYDIAVLGRKKIEVLSLDLYTLMRPRQPGHQKLNA